MNNHRTAPVINHSQSYYVNNFQPPSFSGVGGVGNKELSQHREDVDNKFSFDEDDRKSGDQQLETPGPILNIFSNNQNSHIESWPRPSIINNLQNQKTR